MASPWCKLLLVTILSLGCSEGKEYVSLSEVPQGVEGGLLAVAAWESQPELPGLTYECIQRAERVAVEVMPASEVAARCHQPGPLGACIFVAEPRIILGEEYISPGLIRHELLHFFSTCTWNESTSATVQHRDRRVWGVDGADGYYPRDTCGVQ